MNQLQKVNVFSFLIRKNTLYNYNNKCQFSIAHLLQINDIGNRSSVNKSENVSFDEIQVLVNNLDEVHKRKLLNDLQYLESDEKKKIAEEKLASWIWRSHFGRPTVQQIPDASGKFCEIPSDWLQRKVDEQAKPKPLDPLQLRQVAIFNALPFVGFGFLDNLIMIVAGDYIDTTIGTYLGISTLAAAALGNTISDLAGIGSAWYVESIASKIGVRSPKVTPAQLETLSARRFANLGRSIGVVLGCILGMFPLFFLPVHTKKDIPDEEA